MATVLRTRSVSRTQTTDTPRPKRRVWTSQQWLDYFRHNAAHRRPIPWELGPGVEAQELDAIGKSMQAWQLGETSDGRHLRAAAARYAEECEDALFPEVAEYFIREEQGHSAMMGHFLDMAGLGRVTHDWGDQVFRTLRYRRCDLESWTTPVIVVEVLALVYFDAVRHATQSTVLNAMCSQILYDEVAHIRFQSERFAMMFRDRLPQRRQLSLWTQRMLFLSGVLAVWAGHRRALQAGGYTWRRYWSSAWRYMEQAWARMDPERYEW